MQNVLLTILLLLPVNSGAQMLSGGVDARYTRGEAAELRSVFLNWRNVWSDDLGDRWIAVAQIDLDHNLSEVKPYQVYGQYKGPLGRWNVRAGHAFVPFGLLATLDTERLLLHGIEEETIGIRLDTGLSVLGRAGAIDYVGAVSTGTGDPRHVGRSAAPLFSGRAAYVNGDSLFGLSVLSGEVATEDTSSIRKRLGALDATMSLGRTTLRAEFVAGTTDGETNAGGLLLADYSITPRFDLNGRYAQWDETHSAAIGGTLRLDHGFAIRVAAQHHFRDVTEAGQNEIGVQLTYEFQRLF